MKKIIIITLSFLFLSNSLTAQSLVGTIKVTNTEETIPYATVQIGENYGTITNEEGVFNINIDNFKPTDSIKFSCLSFKTKTLVIKDFKNIVFLDEQINSLDEVTISDEKKLTALEIIAKANNNLNVNYKTFKNTNNKIFYRTKNIITTKDNKFFIKKAKNIDKKIISKINKFSDSLRQSVKNSKSTHYKDVLANLYFNRKAKQKSRLRKRLF